MCRKCIRTYYVSLINKIIRMMEVNILRVIKEDQEFIFLCIVFSL